MEIEYKIDKSNFIFEVWIGQIDKDEIPKVQRKRNQKNSYNKKVIVDATYASFNQISDLDIREFQELYFLDRDIKAGAQMAVICPNEFSKAQILEKIASENRIDSIVFSSIDIACIWLGLDNFSEVYTWVNTTRSKLLKHIGKNQN